MRHASVNNTTTYRHKMSNALRAKIHSQLSKLILPQHFATSFTLLKSFGIIPASTAPL